MGSSASQDGKSPYETAEPSEVNYSRSDQKSVTAHNEAATSHDGKKRQTDLLKRMFFKLDPAVMKGSNDVDYGQVKLAFKYVTSQELFLVKVHEVKQLAIASVRGNSAKPYIQIDLVPPKKGCNVTVHEMPENEPKRSMSASDPNKLVFDEIFSFKIPKDCLDVAKFRCTVWSSDGFEQDGFLGEVYFNLLDLDCFDTIKTSWLDLHAQTDLSICGEINLHLAFKLPQSLIVTINSARGVGEVTDASHLTAKVVLPGVPHVFQTTPVRGGEEYTWIETFTFPVPREELTNRHLVIVVSDAKRDESYLGECHIDLDAIDLMRGYEGTFRLSDLRGSSVIRSRWSRNAVTQELQEALLAHSVYMRPRFLFDSKCTQSKVVSVNVPKAFVTSQMRVVNGVVVR